MQLYSPDPGNSLPHIEPLDGRVLFAHHAVAAYHAGAYQDGVCANFNGFAANGSAVASSGEIVSGNARTLWKTLQSLETPYLRVFHTIRDFSGSGNDMSPGEVSQLKFLSTHGIKVTLCFTPKEVPNDPGNSIHFDDITYNNTSKYFLGLFNKYDSPGADLSKYVDRWELGNEVNLGQYFPQPNGSTSRATESVFISKVVPKYVADFERPAWDVLKAKGQTVVGGSAFATNYGGKAFTDLATTPVTYTNRAGRKVRAYYGTFCDIANIHPYEPTAAGEIRDLKNAMTALKSVTPGGKPLTVTEWAIFDNNRPSDSDATIVAEQNQVQDFMRHNIDSAYFYRIRYRSDKHGNWGLFAADFSTPRGPAGDDYVQMFLRWRKSDRV